MTRADSGDGKRQSRRRRVVSLGTSAAVVTALLLAACSSDKAAAPTSEGPTSTRLELGGNLQDKPAAQALLAIFKAAGIEAATPQLQSSTTIIPVCPLGETSALIARPPAPVTGLDTKTTFTLERPAAPDPGIRCLFSNDLPADVANSIPANRTSSFVEYQVTYVPGPQLNAYLGFLAGQGYDQVPNAAVGGAVYTHCAQPDATASTSFVDCGAIWTNSVIVVGLRYTGPGDKSIDVPQWLVAKIAPILDTLSKASPESVVGPAPTTTP